MLAVDGSKVMLPDGLEARQAFGTLS